MPRCVFVWQKYILLLFLWQTTYISDRGDCSLAPKTLQHLFPQKSTPARWTFFVRVFANAMTAHDFWEEKNIVWPFLAKFPWLWFPTARWWCAQHRFWQDVCFLLQLPNSSSCLPSFSLFAPPDWIDHFLLLFWSFLIFHIFSYIVHFQMLIGSASKNMYSVFLDVCFLLLLSFSLSR